MQGILSVLGKVVELSLVQAVLSLYTLFFGFVIIMLEGQGSLYPLKVLILLTSVRHSPHPGF
jgi:hypothetical protein